MLLGFVLLLLPISWSSTGIILKRFVQTEISDMRSSPTTYTEIEKNALVKFREMVADVEVKELHRTDQYLVRWIRVADYDLNVANKMFRETQQWRKDYRVDSILDEDPFTWPHADKVCTVKGVAKDGRPIFSVAIHKYMDIRKVLLSGLRANLTRKLVQCLETVVVKLENLTKATGRDVTQAVGITDGSGYNLRQHGCAACIGTYVDFLRDGQDHYPEYTGLSVIVNSPTILKPLIEMSKSVMHATTLKSLRVFGTDKTEWTSFLLKHIAPDQLSRKFGGTADW